MRHAIISALPVLLAACTADLIRHDAGGVLTDSGAATADAASDAGAAEDATVVDSGPVDVGPSDAGPSGCQLAVTPTEVAFPLTQVGATSTASVLVQNIGFAECNAAAWAAPRGAGFTVTPPWGAILQPGDSDPLTVAFSPTEPGKASAAAVVGTLETEAAASLHGEAYLPEVASTRQVIFQVRNTTREDRYLVLEGRDCVGLDPGAPQMLSFQCGCECPPPPTPHGRVYQRIEPGASFDLVWDARTLVTTPYDEFCGPPALGNTAPRVHGAPQPAAAGAYTARVVFERSIPAGCIESAGELSCESFEPATETPPMVAELCPSTFEASVAFTLPATGDLTVPVAIGN